MATFFGELNPLSSRAVDDEEADNQPKFTISYEVENEKGETLLKPHLMIFAIGDIALAFAQSNFLFDNSKIISRLNYARDVKDSPDALAPLKKAAKTVLSVYAASSRVILCQASGFIPDEICFEVTEILFKNFDPENVLVLTSQHMSFYRCEGSRCMEPFLKSLSTSQYLTQHSCGIPRVKPPNFLSSLPASLLLKCETLKIPGLCIVNYVDTYNVDSLVVEVFNTILNEAILSTADMNKDAPERLQKYIKSKVSSNSNLYA